MHQRYDLVDHLQKGIKPPKNAKGAPAFPTLKCRMYVLRHFFGGHAICDTGVAYMGLICDTTLRWRQTPQIDSKLPRVCRHDVRLTLKLSLSQNGPVFEEICGILVQPKKVQNGCEHKP